eukprot:gnl/TRDRNA2_/TRDRNA2_43080_c0_seq1.p1 gnl/TRDRNA2_/TRDRNA2_43080_c0~~gnl/TRDRNA2_/TRDRNA2_43080_c0_seq1.p1  ORF type:complete len:283 (-),score=36.02 gnl/TRDRNA2_/TRDRNA2_43080_c0_seq1:92-880(-)
MLEAPCVFQPPPRTSAPCGHDQQDPAVPVGGMLERCLDDFCQIWATARVLRSWSVDGTRTHMYDLEYVDDGAVEEGVEASETRLPTSPTRSDFAGHSFDDSAVGMLPVVVWQAVASCLADRRSLLVLETLARELRADAGDINGHLNILWWRLYHLNFGQCCHRCCYQPQCADEGMPAHEYLSATAVVCTTFQAAQDKFAWKAHYARRYQSSWSQQDRSPSQYTEDDAPIFAASGAEVSRRQNSNTKGLAYDPRVGGLVRCDG